MAKQATDPELDAAQSQVEALKQQLAPTVGAAPAGAGAQAIDPTMILAILDVILKLIERFRNRP